jgi:polysaccharide export outer membrane protein
MLPRRSHGLEGFVLLAALSATAPPLGGCVSAPPYRPPPKPYTYVIGAGDILRIEVFREPALQHDVTVTPDGRISFPLVGSLAVQGSTIQAVADGVAAELVRREELKEPRVHVRLLESRSAQVQVMGEVLRQGPVPFRENMSVTDAVGTAGGPLLAFAKSQDVRVIRGSLDRPQLIAVDLDQVFDGKHPDCYLRPGDIVVVPTRWVTSWDRFISQLLTPLGTVSGATIRAASAGYTVAPP